CVGRWRRRRWRPRGQSGPRCSLGTSTILCCKVICLAKFETEPARCFKMRNLLAKVVITSLAVTMVGLAPVHAQERGEGAQAQGRGGRGGGGRGGGRGAQPGFVASGVPEMPTPPGPAPKQDFTGTWVGPVSITMGPYAPFTAAGKAAADLNHK